MDYKSLFEKTLKREISELKIYYEKDGFVLAKADSDLCFLKGESGYTLGSHPCEPCLYILKDGNLLIAIHNSFDKSTIEKLAKEGGTVTAITGNTYDLQRICELISCACNYGSDCDISYIEGIIAVEKLLSLGAVSSETAVPLEALKVRMISDAFSHSKRLEKRVMYTEDNKVYVRIKK